MERVQREARGKLGVGNFLGFVRWTRKEQKVEP